MSKVLVLGGSSGIGEALVRLLTEQKDAVVFTYCKNEKNAKVLAQATNAKDVFYDQNSKTSVSELIKFIAQDHFDALVNNAAEPYRREAFLDLNANELIDYLDRGMRGAVQVCQAFAASVRDRKVSGSIVHVLSSVVLGLPPEKQSSYVALKYAWLGLSRSQAVEFKPWSIRVNSVSPGMTKTSFISDLPERLVKFYEQTLPMGRIATPEEVARVIRFLMSTEASYISGANVPITGGQVY